MFNLNSVCPKKAKYYIIWWNHWVGVTEGIRKQILITNPDLPYFSQSCTWKANKSWFLARFVSVTLSIMPRGYPWPPTMPLSVHSDHHTPAHNHIPPFIWKSHLWSFIFLGDFGQHPDKTIPCSSTLWKTLTFFGGGIPHIMHKKAGYLYMS